MLEHFPMTMRSIMATEQAMKQGYRIEPCAKCGGPFVYAKTTPAARCLRCGHRSELKSIKAHKTSFRRCAVCDKQNMIGVSVNSKYCRTCEALPPRQRAKLLRWKAERVKSPSDSPNKNGAVLKSDSTNKA